MSKYSSFDPVTGRHGDIVIHRRGANGASLVSLGERTIGQVFGPDSYDGWTALSHAQPPRLIGIRMVRGFRSRWKAVEYLLDVGVRLPDNRCIPELDHHPVGYHNVLGDGRCHP